jgi:RNA polymerase sigma factor (sigma-70 family)
VAAFRGLGDDAEDVINTFYLKDLPGVVENFDAGRGKFQSYFLKSFHRRCGKVLAEIGKANTEFFDSAAEDAVHKAAARSFCDGDVERRLIRALDSKVQASKVGAMVALLPETDQRVLALRYEQELSIPAIAVWMELTVPAVKMRLFRACQKLGYLLEQEAAPVGLRDITDWCGFLRDIARAAVDPAPSPGARIWALLPERCRAITEDAADRGKLAELDKLDVLDAINSALARDDFFDSEHFASAIETTPDVEVRKVLDDGYRAHSVTWWNRLLLHASYPYYVVPPEWFRWHLS